MLHTHVRGIGTPLLVLPWFGIDGSAAAAAFDSTMPAGRSRRYVDLPGTGDSPGGVPASEAVLEEVIALLESLGFAADLVGLSYGGYLALAAARRRPELVRSLLHVCGGVRLRSRDLEDLDEPPADVGWLDLVPEDLHDHLLAAVGNRTAETAARVCALIGTSRTDADYLDALRAGSYALHDETGAPTEVPVTAVVGGADGIVGVRDQRYLGRYVRIAAAGHYLPLEQPAQFTPVVASWLR